MPKRTRSYETDLIKELKNPEEAAAYLNAHLGEDSQDSEELFLLALRDVAQAHGIVNIAERSNLGRESIYKTLSSEGNPKFYTLKSILKSMGLKLFVEQEKKKAS